MNCSKLLYQTALMIALISSPIATMQDQPRNQPTGNRYSSGYRLCDDPCCDLCCNYPCTTVWMCGLWCALMACPEKNSTDLCQYRPQHHPSSRPTMQEQRQQPHQAHRKME